MLPLGSKFNDTDHCNEILLLCSGIQLLCEEIARQQSIENNGNTQCRSLKRFKVLLFHVNSSSDPTCLLQHYLRSHNQYISYAAAKALLAWLKAAADGACRVFLDRLLNNIVTPLATSLSILNTSGIHGPLPHTVSNLLDILKNCIETPDVEPHPTEGATEDEGEDTNYELQDRFTESHLLCQGSMRGNGDSIVRDVESDLGGEQRLLDQTLDSLDTDATSEDIESKDLKGSVIRALGKHWNVIVTYFHAALTLAQSATNLHSEDVFPLVSFLSLWQSTISLKTNVSVLDSKPFYLRMEALLPIMTPSLDSIIWREIINLFNEVLCYGSTLALQDFLPDEPCNLAHLVIRHVRAERLLERAPIQPGRQSASDRSLMQKLVLLVLKAVAVTVKETRSESSSLESESNSESGHPSDPLRSEDSEDLHADMTVILRSIKQVFRVVDGRIKTWLPFHPETALSEWLVKIFNDQDDALIETMLCTLDINNGLYSNCRGLNATSNSLQTGLLDLRGTLNPVQTWLKFLETVSYDPDVLLDLLVSNETCFLLYMLRLLKFIRRNWDDFLSVLSHRQLEDVMTCFIRLRIAIRRLVSKNLFPYNIGPIVKLLEKCEELYEGIEN